MYENLVSFGSKQLTDKNFYMNWHVRCSGVHVYNNKELFKIYFPYWIETINKDILENED